MCKPGKGLTIKNILLDRDGTIIEDKGYLCKPEEVVFIDGVIEALKRMVKLGVNIFIVTNQSGIGRGYFLLEDYMRVRDRIFKILKENEVIIKDETFCPHSPEEGCDCRKPKTGMWKFLSKKYCLKASETVVIGDKLTDIEFGSRINARFKVLVLTGKGKEEAERLNGLKSNIDNLFPDLIAKDLPSALMWLEEFIR